MVNAPVSKVSVALSPTEIAIIKKLRRKLGLNFSAATRIIIREWEEHKLHRTNGNGKAHIVAAQPSAVEEQ